MLSNLAGWHILIILAVLILIAAAIVGAVALLRWATRGRGAADPGESERLRREAAELRDRAERAERDTDGLV